MSFSKHHKVSSGSRSDSPNSVFVRATFLLLVALIPLVLSRTTFNGYDLPKATILRLAAIGFLGASALEAVASGHWRWKRSELELPLVGLFLVAALSTMFSIDPLTSLLGDYTRQEGLLTLSNYFLVFLFAVNYLNQDRWRELVLSMWFATASLVALYGIFQHFGLDFLKYSGQQFFELERSFSTLGNPIRLSTYLVLTFPLALSRLLAGRSKDRYLAGVTLALILPCILFTYSRAGWVGLLVSFVLFVSLVRRNLLVRKNKEAAVMLAVVVALTVSLGLLPHNLTGKYEPSKRLVSTLAVKSGSVATRIELYRAAIMGISERPFLGYGLSTFRYIFHKFRSLRAVILEKDATYDRAHSDFLQVASDLGMIGLLAYLWLMITLYRKGYSLLTKTRDGTGRTLMAGELAGIVGYLAAIQFSFGGIGETAMFWVLAGLLLGRVREIQDYEISLHFLGRKTHWRAFAYLFVFFLSAGALALTVSHFVADHYFFRGVGYQSRGELDRATAAYEKAISLNRFQAFYNQYLATAYHSRASEARQPEEASYWLSEAKLASLKALSLSYPIVDSRLELMRLSVLSGAPSRAIDYGEEVLRFDPYSFDAHEHLGLLYLSEGHISRAILHLEMAKRIDPRNGKFRYLLANSYERQGRKQAAIWEYQQTLKLDPNNAEARDALQRLLGQ